MSNTIHISNTEKTIISSSNFLIEEGKINVIFGESGIGKSLLSKTIFGLLENSDLSISIGEQPYSNYLEIEKNRTQITNGFYVFQEPSSYFNPLMTIEEQVNEGDLSSSQINESLFNELWEDNKWTDLLNIYPKDHRPSGGEKQRIYNLLALKKMRLAENGFFVFDEPTGNLDEFHRDRFLNALLTILKEKKHTVILISHDYSIIDYFSNSLLKNKFKIVYKELVRIKDTVSLDNFKTEHYIQLKRAFPEELSCKLSTDTTLSISSEICIFDKALCFYQNNKLSDFKLSKGTISYLKAKSGLGKTSVAKVLLGLIQANKIAFDILGHHFSEKTSQSEWKRHIWAKKIGMVFQHADRALNAESNVWEVFKHLPVQNLSRKMVYDYIAPFFNASDESFLNKKIITLSGGQKQRINLLRTFILNTNIIILDEPFTGLDIETMKIVLQLVVKKLKEGTSFLLISHNETIFDKIIPIENVWNLDYSK